MSARDKVWYGLLTSAIITHVLIAWGLVTVLPVTNPTPSQELLERFIPEELWPFLFLLCAFLAAWGMWNIRAVQAHFILAGTLMLIFGSIGVYLARSPVILASSVLLIHMAVLKYSLAWYAPGLIKTHKQTVKLLTELEHVNDSLQGHISG